jgi:hypothetical protein
MMKIKKKQEKEERRTGRGKAKKSFKFKSKVFVWNAGNQERRDDSSSWRFARVPEGISAKIKEIAHRAKQKGIPRRGWGAVYAKVKVGKSEWVTSVFPEGYSATYILPLKKEIRYQENLYDGIDIRVSIEIWF